MIGCCYFFPSFKSTLFLKMQLKDVVAKLFELWNLMDSSKEERNCFMKITSIVETSESEITERGVLSTEMIEKVWKLLSVPSPFVISYFHLCICLLLVFIFCLLCAIAYLFCVIILAELFQLMHLGIWCIALVFLSQCHHSFIETWIIWFRLTFSS